MGSSVLGELVTLIRDHPYISCFLLVFLTPPFWPILMYFSPLLISTALFLVALITMGPQFEEEEEEGPPEHEYRTPIEDEHPAPRRVATEESYRKPSKGVGDWVSSWKDSGLMWVEHKLQNKNWRGASLTDENVSILQEAFAHRVEEKPRVMVKLMTRRIPAEEDEDHTRDLHTRELSHSGSWNSFRGRSPSPTRDIPHDFFAPHRSLSRRLDSDASLFENVEPPPIEHDMPPQITGPASVTAPILKYIEDGSDSDEYDHHHHDEHLEFGERSLDAESISQDELSLANGTYGQPPPFTVREEDLPSSGSSDEGRQFFAELHHGTSEIESLPPSEDQVHTRDLDLHEVAGAPPHVEIVHEEPPHEEPPPPPPAAPEEPPHADELHDIPELEDVAPPEVETRDIEAPVVAAAAAPEHETSEAPAAAPNHGWKHEALEALEAAALEHETSEAPAAHEHEVLEAPPAAHEHEILEAPAAAAHEHEVHETPAAAHEHEVHETPAAAHEHEILEAPVAAHEHEVFEAPAAAPEHEAPAALEVHEAPPPPAAPEHEHSEAPAPEHEPSEAHPAAVDEHHAHEEPEVSAHHGSEEVPKDLEVPHVAFAPEPEVAPDPVHVRDHSMERSMSMPVAASLATAASMEPEMAHEALAPVPEPRSLGNAISLPSGSNAMLHPLIIPPNTSEQQQGPLSPDTDLGYATTPDHDRTRALAGRFFAPERYNSITSMSGDESEVAVPSKILSAQERLSKLEALSNSMPLSGEVSGRRDVSILRATTDEQITHVSDKLRAYKEDSSSKRFQPDAPQLQITPPSMRAFPGPPSKSALLSQTIGRPSIRQVSKFAEKYVSSSSDSSSEEIELDSDGAGDGSESDSDFESLPVKPPPKPPQGKKTTEPVKKK